MSDLRSRNLILHIGDPKTGSSSIQRALQFGLIKGHDKLISVFLNSQQEANAVAVARGFRAGESRRRFQASIKEIVSWLSSTDSDYPILSSEFFSEADPKLVRRAFETIRPFPKRQGFFDRLFRRERFQSIHSNLAQNTRVIGYVRPHAGRALAAFSERAKCGYTLRDFDGWLTQVARSDLLLYTPRFLAWKSAFGDRFTLRPFLREELEGGDVVMDFFTHVLGAGKFSAGDSVNENQALSMRSLTGMLTFNREIAGSGMPTKQRLLLARRLAKGLPSAGPKERLQLDRRSLSRIARFCREDARQLDEEFFDQPLLQNALDRNIALAVDKPIDLTIDRHFTPDEQAQLAGHIAALLKLLAADGFDWQQHYQENLQHYNRGIAPETNASDEIEERLGPLRTLFH